MEEAGSVSDVAGLVVAGRPLIDVRSPAEFAAGAMPNAVNLPLLSDEERHRVGLSYRHQGREEATRLGRRLVAGATRARRLARWCAFVEQERDAALYCARGGLRSQIVQQWIREASGRSVDRVAGGYKALRRFLLGRLEPAAITGRPILLGGRTGVGKTELLRDLPNGVDLEAIANHRGSSFGRLTTPQPSQADFENRLAAALIIHGHRNFRHLIVEDEGRHVGRCYLPKQFADFLGGQDLVLLEAPLEQRVETIFAEYVAAGQAALMDGSDARAGLRRWRDEMRDGMARIRKRLGPDLLARVTGLLAAACEEQEQGADATSHKRWIELLLRHYYDPMYDYQLGRKSGAVLFRGQRDEVRDFFDRLGP